MDFIKKIIASFDNSQDGFSARKLSAFAGVSVGVIITFKYIEPQYLIEALIVWLCFSLLCLGIVTMEQVIKLKNGGSNETSTKIEVNEVSGQ